MLESKPNPELMIALGRLVRGLSALFWGLPLALVVCVQTAKGEWLRSFGVVPPLIATGLLFYGVLLLRGFHPQERVWRQALDRAQFFALINVGLSPFLFWWSKIPQNVFFSRVVQAITISGLLFLFILNPLLWRLAAMLPDETLRHETKLFTTMNQWLIVMTVLLITLFLVLSRIGPLPKFLIQTVVTLEEHGVRLVLFLVLLPVAMTMALIWKTKEVILSGVFGATTE